MARPMDGFHHICDAKPTLDRALDLLYAIQGALGTAETGDALVEVARNAHRAEQDLAARIRREESERDFLDDCAETALSDS